MQAMSVISHMLAKALGHSWVQRGRLTQAESKLRAQLTAEQKAHRETKLTLIKTQRAWAANVMGFLKGRGMAMDDSYALSLSTPLIAALINQYKVHPLGWCEHCGKRAPLTDTHHAGKVCAWGCEPSELELMNHASER